MAERRALSDQEIENVAGGYMSFNNETMILTYTHEDGSVTTHEILDYNAAWGLSNEMHAQNYREDSILKKMKAKGYIA